MVLHNHSDEITQIKEYMIENHIFNVEFLDNDEILLNDVDNTTKKVELQTHKKYPKTIISDDICVKNTISYNKNTNMCFNVRVSNSVKDLILTTYDAINDERTLGPFFNKWFPRSRERWLEKAIHYYGNYDWMLVSTEVYNELKNIENFRSLLTKGINKEDDIITLFGYIYNNDKFIYIFATNISSDYIYIGQIDSIQTIISNDVDIVRDGERDILSMSYNISRGSGKIIKYNLK